jgi:hypothetical protein
MITKKSLNETPYIRCISKSASIFLLLAIIACSGIFTVAAHAVTSISQSYTSTASLPVGSLVSLKNNTAAQVVPSSTANVDNLFGIVINADSSLLSLSNGKDNQVQVATSGTVQVLVSDINGTIHQGDNITASPIVGVGMRATGNSRIIGAAQSDIINGSKQDYAGKDNSRHSVMVGEVSTLVNVSYFYKQPEKTIVPGAIQNIANALAGKTVNTLPIIISGAIFIIMLIAVASMIYAMIRSSIISVGRNPMSQSAVYRNLIQLSSLVLVILGVGLVSIYMVLTRL